MRLIDADKMATNELVAFIYVQAKTTDAAIRDQGIAHPNAYHLTNYAMLILREAPTVDAVEVVRCRNCKYHEDTSITEYEHCCLIGKTVRHDDFRSYGERKEGVN